MSGVDRKHVLAIASGGGHWQQLLRLGEAFANQRVTYVTTDSTYAVDVPGSDLFVVTDANRNHPFRLIRLAFEVFVRVLVARPDVVISTGAAPGLFGVIFGRVVGAKTIWVDSIANAEEISMSGRVALKFANITLTQWPHLAGTEGPQHRGSIL